MLQAFRARCQAWMRTADSSRDRSWRNSRSLAPRRFWRSCSARSFSTTSTALILRKSCCMPRGPHSTIHRTRRRASRPRMRFCTATAAASSLSICLRLRRPLAMLPICHAACSCRRRWRKARRHRTRRASFCWHTRSLARRRIAMLRRTAAWMRTAPQRPRWMKRRARNRRAAPWIREAAACIRCTRSTAARRRQAAWNLSVLCFQASNERDHRRNIIQ
mmetsp:Transcript_18193/g.51978  ORF Transcript_18193/g.51978 Transcript_18193/m.51978 type:complete len:219 (-) Transcript_18193:49-705(-)